MFNVSQNISLNPNTILFYPFEGNTFDKTIKANNAIINGSLNYTIKRPMPLGSNSITNFSISNFLTVPSSFFSLINGLSNFCVEFFINWNSIRNGDNIAMSITQNGTGATNVFYFDNIASLGIVGFGNGAGLTPFISYTFTPLLNTWYYVGFSWDGTTRKLYFDPANNISKTPKKTDTGHSATFGTIDAFEIGTYIPAPSVFSDSNIKNFRFSNSSTLTFGDMN